MKSLDKLLTRIIRYKTYIDRSRAYVSYFQFIVMLLVMLKVYDDTSWGMWLFAHKVVLGLSIVMLFAIFIVVGYVDRKYIRPKEATVIQQANPMFMELLGGVKEIKDKVCK